MDDRYSYIARIIYRNDDEYDEYFDSEEDAKNWAEAIDETGIAGYQILRRDWYMHCEAVIDDCFDCYGD